MKALNILKAVCRFLFTTVFRLAATAAAVVLLVCVGLCMVMSLIFNGPSETARDHLTTTLMEHETTARIVPYFLDQNTIDQICAAEDTLPAEISDAALVTVSSGRVRQKNTVLQAETYTATVSMIGDLSEIEFPDGDGDNYVGFCDDVLLVTASKNAAAEAGISSRCGKILIMNGQINEGLYNSQSGYAARYAIGQQADGTMILVTVGGITEQCLGATYQDLIDIMTEYGAVNACCLPVSTPASEE